MTRKRQIRFLSEKTAETVLILQEVYKQGSSHRVKTVPSNEQYFEGEWIFSRV